MVNGTAIHWHGMFQNGTNWMDGTSGVTQCPIPPGQSFTYNFTVPNQWGTFWWHAHAGSQYVDGIVGPLIIHSPDEPHVDKYNQDLIMMVSDHYHTDSGSLVAWYLSTASEGVEPVPDNGLINGRNSFDCSMAPEALFPSAPGSGNGKNRCISDAPRTIFEVEQGLTYRIRIINTGSFADFKVSVDEHELTVIEADGVDMVPVKVQRVPIHVAQSRIAKAFSQEPPESADWKESAWSPHCDDLKAEMLKPFFARDAPKADIQVVLEMSFQTITRDRVNMGYVNRTSWRPQLDNPTMLQVAEGGGNSAMVFDASQLVVTLETVQTVEIVVNSKQIIWMKEHILFTW
ncbi:hypothetical protein BGZ96_006803 [Linnemannia gamsii]|uniref:Laccase n=1 Tax=Linnemannia gamsii TaxID=64522 RepID=A0ABQ7K307_9FUNG|nr:hypothetical protein BGZ96_006803 [Linnemannia gamsii]